MSYHYIRVFLAVTALWLGLLISGAAIASDVEPKFTGVSPLSEACRNAPKYTKLSVKYSDTVKRDASTIWSRKTWLQLFPARVVYSIPTLEIKLYERSPQVPRGFDPEEEVAFVLGQIVMPSESGCGLLVLEDGYYSSTRIVLYPVLTNGKSGEGLVLADHFADESEEIVASSNLSSTRQRTQVTTKIVKSMSAVEPVGDSGDAARKRKVLKELRHVWEFEKKASKFIQIKKYGTVK